MAGQSNSSRVARRWSSSCLTFKRPAFVREAPSATHRRRHVVGVKKENNHMEQPIPSSSVRAQPGLETFGRNEAHSSGVSWAAIIAGAFVAAALSLALLALGVGIGFSTVSPWATAATSGPRIGRTAIAWLVLMQLIASSVGGYL